MADLIITLKGDAGDFKKQFDQAIASLNKFGNETKASQGYIGSMESQMKLLKTQMKGAAEQDLPALRAQFLNLKTAIREAQYGTETFTSKIGGSFDQALQKASKTLFGMGNIIKASLGAFGVAGIVSSFIQATGAAEALDKAIQGVVQGIRDIGKSQVELDLQNTTLPVIERAKKFIESQVPVGDRTLSDLEGERRILQGQLAVSQLQKSKARSFDFKGGTLQESLPGILSVGDEERIRQSISEINLLIQKLNELQAAKGRAGVGGAAVIGGADDSFFRAAAESRTSSTFDEFLFNRRQKEIEERREASRQRLLEADKLREKEEENIRRVEQMRMQSMDRIGARIGQTAEDALSAGLRGGFQDFLQSYLQQTGLRLFSGLIRLAFSSATGGGFGPGNLLGHIFGFAGGGEFYTKGPMPIMVGDNPGGIEKVTVEPISGRGTSGLKNGNLALAGGGTVMSAPMMGGNSGSPINVTLMLDKHELGRAWFEPNGVLESINRSRGNPE